MPGAVIGTALNNGFVGQTAFAGDELISPRAVLSSSAEIPFGFPVVSGAGGTYAAWGATNVDGNLIGISHFNVRQPVSYPSTDYAYQPGQVCDAMVRGAIVVACTNGTPAVDGAVYCRVAAAAGRPIGAFEAAADGANSVTIANLAWASTKDANGNAVVLIKERLAR